MQSVLKFHLVRSKAIFFWAYFSAWSISSHSVWAPIEKQVVLVTTQVCLKLLRSPRTACFPTWSPEFQTAANRSCKELPLHGRTHLSMVLARNYRSRNQSLLLQLLCPSEKSGQKSTTSLKQMDSTERNPTNLKITSRACPVYRLLLCSGCGKVKKQSYFSFQSVNQSHRANLVHPFCNRNCSSVVKSERSLVWIQRLKNLVSKFALAESPTLDLEEWIEMLQ